MNSKKQPSEETLSVSRQIRAIHNDNTIRVYQAYNAAIADAAVAANSFHAPLQAGIWSSKRMTWIKPSKVWMAYRCGWTVLKNDANQARVLALDLSRPHFESVLMGVATISEHNNNSSSSSCRSSNVVLQWDPERFMSASNGDPKQVYTVASKSIRSIQIGLRAEAVAELLLDEKALVKISDVTRDFQRALEALQKGDLQQAREALWPDPEHQESHVSDLSDSLQGVLRVTSSVTAALVQSQEGCTGGTVIADAPPPAPQRLAIVVLGSAANPPHHGHFHCLSAGREYANKVALTTIAIAPEKYLQHKERKRVEEHQQQAAATAELEDDQGHSKNAAEQRRGHGDKSLVLSDF